MIFRIFGGGQSLAYSYASGYLFLYLPVIRNGAGRESEDGIEMGRGGMSRGRVLKGNGAGQRPFADQFPDGAVQPVVKAGTQQVINRRERFPGGDPAADVIQPLKQLILFDQRALGPGQQVHTAVMRVRAAIREPCGTGKSGQ